MSDTSRQPAPASPLPARRGKRILLALITTIVALVWFQIPSRILNHDASQLLDHYQLDRAENRLKTSLALSDSLPETYRLLARTYRKQSEPEAMLAALKKYRDTGGSADLAQRELLLYEVQGGNLEDNTQRMNQLLVEQTGDEREILEAYVNGLLVNTRFEEAYLIIDEWKASFPDDPLPYYARGRAEEHFHREEEARREYEQAITRQPDHARTLYALGRLLRELGDFETASDYYARCREMTYDEAPRIGQAHCLVGLNRYDEAKSLVEPIAAEPSERLSRSYQRVGERLIGRPDAALLAKAEFALENIDSAIEWFERAFAADPTNLDLRYERAIALRRAGRIDEANSELEAVSDARQKLLEVDRLVDTLDPTAPEIGSRLRIAELYMQYGSKQTAEFWLKSLLSFEPDHKQAHQMLADYYAELAPSEPRYEHLSQHHRVRAQ